MEESTLENIAIIFQIIAIMCLAYMYKAGEV